MAGSHQRHDVVSSRSGKDRGLVVRGLDAIFDRWIEWWWLDVSFGILLAATLTTQVRQTNRVNVLGSMKYDARITVYSDLLQLAVLFAGFSGVAFAVYLGMQSRNVRAVQQRVGSRLLRVWLSALITPWGCSLALVIAKVLDRDRPGGSAPAWGITYGVVAIMLFQLVRTYWVFANIAAVDMADTKPAMETAGRPITVVRREASRR